VLEALKERETLSELGQLYQLTPTEISTWKNHCTLYGSVPTGFKEQQKDFNTVKSTIQFTQDEPLPAAFVKELVKSKAAEIEMWWPADAPRKRKDPCYAQPSIFIATAMNAAGSNNPQPSTAHNTMPHCIDAFVLPVPKEYLARCKRMATAAGKIWMEYGALRYWECMGDDLDNTGPMMPFPRMTKCKPAKR